ncbi:MAG: DegT/DnrJ/EryC1/StrS aminotransferase family protein [Bdellovibrionales bacterium]|nr:DegT/DnrJ/EryC1/StrS aminotransferase family protein [Bdellovibrionales bacterium]
MAVSHTDFIPVCEPCFLGNEERYVQDAVRSGWISSAGGYLSRFEEEFAAYCGADFGIACSSGTAALHLALLAHGIGAGDEVIIPDFTMVAVLNAVLYCGATPVFVDVEADTWNIDADLLREKVSSRTKAAIVVHTYGHPCEMGAIRDAAVAAGIPIIEDAAEAHGAEYQGVKCGNLGAAACFSFFGNKIITTGEGGMVVTSDRKIAERCRYFRNLCFSLEGPRDYRHGDVGYNYRMTNLQAALGCAQLERLDELAERRIRNAKRYTRRLSQVPGLACPVERQGVKNVYWMYGLVVDEAKFGISRDALMAQLTQRGVDSRLFFKPLHSQPLLQRFGLAVTAQYPVTESLSARGLYLPSGSGLTDDQLDRVCAAIEAIHHEAKR